MPADGRRTHAWTAPGGEKCEVEKMREGQFMVKASTGALLEELLSLAESLKQTKEEAGKYRRALRVLAVVDGPGPIYCRLCGARAASGKLEHREECLLHELPKGPA